MLRTVKLLASYTLAATLVACATYPCEEEGAKSTAQVVSGGEGLRVTCAGGAEHSLTPNLEYTSFTPEYDSGFSVDLDSGYLTGKPNLILDIFIPKDLEDGTYDVGGASDAIRVSRRGLGTFSSQGTIAFRRTRNLPLMDEPEPAEGTQSNIDLDVTLNLTGKMSFDAPCGEGTFSTGTLKLHFERSSTVTRCEEDPRRGLPRPSP